MAPESATPARRVAGCGSLTDHERVVDCWVVGVRVLGVVVIEGSSIWV
jgi:hypothetical protein